MPPLISFVVSAYNRPSRLAALLYSLRCQTEGNFEVIVCDNHPKRMNRAVVLGIEDKRFRYLHTAPIISTSDCYYSAEEGARRAIGEWLCFPNDDCLYFPDFAEQMILMAGRYNWGLVCCDLVYRWNSGESHVLHVVPDAARGTKTCFMVKRHLFSGFSCKPTEGKPAPCAADAIALLEMCATGTKHGTVQQVLGYHG